MRYEVIFDMDHRQWLVVDRFVADQIVGVHKTEQAAVKHAASEERSWSIYRSPAEDVALMMA